jgi:hypothetical protein
MENLEKAWQVFQVFSRYAWYEKLSLVLFIPFALYISYLVTLGRPPLTIYRLFITPGYNLTKEGYMSVGLDMDNQSAPPAEIHNIEGEVWITAPTVIHATRSPSRVYKNIQYYDVRETLLHKRFGGNIVRWLIVPPNNTERFWIRYRIVSSETEPAAGGWQIVNENGKLKIVESK